MIGVVLLLIIALALIIVASIQWYLNFRNIKRNRIRDPLRCAHCGYDLTGYQMPRCPECGKAIGFCKTFEELGVDETEVLRHVEDKRRQQETDEEEPGAD